jgi:hypothetical protein
MFSVNVNMHQVSEVVDEAARKPRIVLVEGGEMLVPPVIDPHIAEHFFLAFSDQAIKRRNLNRQLAAFEGCIRPRIRRLS